MKFLIGFPGIAFVTDADGDFTLAPGVPIVDTEIRQTLVAGLVATDDSFLTHVIAADAGVILTPLLVASDDAIYAPTVVPGAMSLLPGPVVSDDAISSPTVIPPAVSLLPGLVPDDGTISAPLVGAPPASLLPALRASDDAFHAPTLTIFLLPAEFGIFDDTLWPASIATFGVTRTLLPSRITDADAIYAADVSFPVARALLPGRVTDADVVYAATFKYTQTLRPGRVTDTEAAYAAYSIDAAKPPKERTLRAPRTNDLDVIFQARLPRTVQLVVADVEFIYAAILDIYYPLTAAFIASDDSFKSPFVAMVVQPETVADTDAILGGLVTLFLLPARVVDDDSVPAADVGWQVITQFVNDIEGAYETFATYYNELLPEVLEEDDVIDTYPFFLQAIIGGIPVPKPFALTGSINSKRHLKGTISSRIRLTGSIKGPIRLTGSIKHR